MKKSLVIAWLSALRSGEYKQMRGQINNGVYKFNNEGMMIKRPDEFCCIGVGAACNGMRLEYMKRTDDASKFLGIHNESIVYDRVTHDIPDVLISMNDKDGKTFPEIADWIEANILPNATEG